MEFTAAVIAGFLNGIVEGNPEIKVNTVAKIEEGQPAALSFLANPKYEQYIYTTKSSVVLVNKGFIASAAIEATLIRVDDAYESFASLLRMVDQATKPKKKGIHPSAVIEASASIGSEVYIGPFAYIGENVVLGDGCSVYPHVYIGDNTRLGENSELYSGVKTIDRATMGSTIIRRGVKLDNLIQIGHNVEVGENTVMAAQTGIAGSTKVGKNCMFGGQVGLAGHIKVAAGTKIGAQGGVAGDIKLENTTIIGSPAIEFRNFLKSSVIFKKLPEMKSKLDSMERDVDVLKKR